MYTVYQEFVLASANIPCLFPIDLRMQSAHSSAYLGPPEVSCYHRNSSRESKICWGFRDYYQTYALKNYELNKYLEPFNNSVHCWIFINCVHVWINFRIVDCWLKTSHCNQQYMQFCQLLKDKKLFFNCFKFPVTMPTSEREYQKGELSFIDILLNIPKPRLYRIDPIGLGSHTSEILHFPIEK